MNSVTGSAHKYLIACTVQSLACAQQLHQAAQSQVALLLLICVHTACIARFLLITANREGFACRHAACMLLMLTPYQLAVWLAKAPVWLDGLWASWPDVSTAMKRPNTCSTAKMKVLKAAWCLSSNETPLHLPNSRNWRPEGSMMWLQESMQVLTAATHGHAWLEMSHELRAQRAKDVLLQVGIAKAHASSHYKLCPLPVLTSICSNQGMFGLVTPAGSS